MSQQNFLPGNDAFAATAAPDGRYGAFFDDDGESAYFYALDLDSDDLILDAVRVYDAVRYPHRKRHSSLSIEWSSSTGCRRPPSTSKSAAASPATMILSRFAPAGTAGPLPITPGPMPPSTGSICANPRRERRMPPAGAFLLAAFR